jgi:hypothetical protein
MKRVSAIGCQLSGEEGGELIDAERKAKGEQRRAIRTFSGIECAVAVLLRPDATPAAGGTPSTFPN